MLLEAKLDIGNGCQYDITDCEFELKQPDEGSLPVGSPLRFTITNDPDFTFIGWLTDGSLKNGSIVISDIKDTGKYTKTVTFENASCVSVREHGNEREFTICIILQAETLKFGSRGELTANQ